MSDMYQHRLDLTMATDRSKDFFPLLQQGILVPCRTGVTLGELLRDQWGIDAGYVKTRITTIFLNHRAIDDMEQAVVRDGATIALSGAMPGLVGATMRCGGHLAAMRGAMTHRDDTDDRSAHEAPVRLKLFNLLLPELGPFLLQRGIIMAAAELTAFLAHRDLNFWQACYGARWDGNVVDPHLLAADMEAYAGSSILLRIKNED